MLRRWRSPGGKVRSAWDGGFIAFFVASEAAIKKVPAGGGPVTIVARTDGGAPRGLAWGSDGSIVFATFTSGGLHRVAAVGATSQRLTTLGRRDVAHWFPTFLPNGRTVLFEAFRGGESAVCAASLASGEVNDLVTQALAARYAATGHLLFTSIGSDVSRSTVQAVPFDPERGALTGAVSVPVQEEVHVADGIPVYDVAGDGSFVYVAGDPGLATSRLVWVDRRGRETPLDFPSRPYRAVSLSPDGRRVALRVQGPEGSELWVSALDRPTLVKLPLRPSSGPWGPMWTTDGRDIIFSAHQLEGSAPALFRTRADGTGSAVPIVTIEDNPFIWPGAWTREGSLLFTYGNRPDLPQSRTGIIDIRARDGTRWQPFLERSGGSGSPAISPDGRWIAYHGGTSIWVEAVEEPGVRHIIAPDPGGVNALWSSDGREIFYRRADDLAIASVRISVTPAFTAAQPEVLFEDAGYLSEGKGWSVDAAGRFLMIKADPLPPRALDLVLVQHWSEQLQRTLPGG